MKKSDKYLDKRVLVLGLGRSGYAAAKLMKSLGADVTVNDRGNLEGNPHAAELKKIGIRVVGGGHPPDLVDKELAVLIKNPGIPYSNPLVQKARQLGIRIITEVEIAYELSDAPFIGITGSNGKTTTTMLLGEMMKGSAAVPIVAGNIGTALTGIVGEATDKNVIVAELSSFQLLGTEQFRPKIAVVLNIFDHHLDYHGTVENYARAKARITVNQTADDVLVYNADSERVVSFIAGKTKARKVPFSMTGRTEDGAYIEDGAIYFRTERILECSEMGLPGTHNLQNALAAVAAAKISGVPTAQIVRILKTFTGVRHRLQYVNVTRGRTVYNDSKATNILATSKALTSFPGKSIVLLAGGLDRGNTFDALIPYLKKADIKAALLFGETKDKLRDACERAGIARVENVENVEQAVPEAFRLSGPGDVVLLSPACASWDQYDSFEQRGDIFISEVNKFR
ncbi:UDP-N-acetylmuramoyl-L-alanine--D-glutamate ligase [Sporolactobacillus sp. KGMB 08714]|uniref:UDP-N-acetylmuramoyl-L-alanine--D-glutamate ligase n=1 Tax=Sporolactobacillus sp. KGMB 08714 TaxID=3064704 RepID=UPI002FBD68BB